LCHVDGKNEITRREGPKRHADGTGWSAIASKASNKPDSATASDDQQSAKGSGKRLMLGLRKKRVDKSSEKPWGVLDGDAEC
jgi:transcriptional repressor NF-X1